MTASDAERKLQELSFLHEIARLASSARDWDEMLRIVIDRTTDAMGAEVSSLYLLEKPDAVLRLVATNGLNRGGIGRATLRIGEGIVGWVALVVDRLVRVYPGASGAIFLRDQDETRERARSGQLGRSAVQAAQRAIGERRPIVAFDHIAIPLVANDRLLGAVVLQVPDYKEFLEEEVRFVGALANQAALAIDKASLYLLERKTTENLRELERARGEFVAVVTHDLRTPLSVIRGYLDQLAEKNGKSAIPVGEATAQVERLDHLVDRILAGVRTDRPELNLRRARFDLRATVAAALKEVAPMARRHKLQGPRSGQPVFVRGDRRRTAEVVAGLVHNATKYAPEGTRITVRIERGDDRAIVRVQDEGPGVPPSDRARIFEPYARGAAHEDLPGSGIGLYASRRVVEGQGGDLWVEDAASGAVFAFSVPLARGAAVATRW